MKLHKDASIHSYKLLLLHTYTKTKPPLLCISMKFYALHTNTPLTFAN